VQKEQRVKGGGKKEVANPPTGFMERADNWEAFGEPNSPALWAPKKGGLGPYYRKGQKKAPKKEISSGKKGVRGADSRRFGRERKRDLDAGAGEIC